MSFPVLLHGVSQRGLAVLRNLRIRLAFVHVVGFYVDNTRLWLHVLFEVQVIIAGHDAFLLGRRLGPLDARVVFLRCVGFFHSEAFQKLVHKFVVFLFASCKAHRIEVVGIRRLGL